MLPLLASLAPYAISAVPGIAKGILGISQLGQKVERTDTTPDAFKEQLANLRQAQASNQLPGMGMLQNRLAQVQSGALQNARLGAASSADFLASAGAADARRQQGEQQLGVQAQQYHDQATQRLNQGLQQQAAYQAADDQRYNQAKAALKGSGLTNLFGGLSDTATVGASAISAINNPAPPPGTGSGVPPQYGNARAYDNPDPYNQGLYNPFGRLRGQSVSTGF